MNDVKHVRIRVFPESSDDRVEDCKDPNVFNVYVQAPAESGQANKVAVQLMQNFLSIDGRLRIVSGHRSPNKILAIDTNK